MALVATIEKRKIKEFINFEDSIRLKEMWKDLTSSYAEIGEILLLELGTHCEETEKVAKNTVVSLKTVRELERRPVLYAKPSSQLEGDQANYKNLVEKIAFLNKQFTQETQEVDVLNVSMGKTLKKFQAFKEDLNALQREIRRVKKGMTNIDKYYSSTVIKVVEPFYTGEGATPEEKGETGRVDRTQNYRERNWFRRIIGF